MFSFLIWIASADIYSLPLFCLQCDTRMTDIICKFNCLINLYASLLLQKAEDPTTSPKHYEIEKPGKRKIYILVLYNKLVWITKCLTWTLQAVTLASGLVQFWVVWYLNQVGLSCFYFLTPAGNPERKWLN